MIDEPTTLMNVLGRLLEAADADPRIAADREAAWQEFRAGREPDDAMRARFEEWYLFERHSPPLGDAPAFVALSERVAEALPPQERDLLDEMAATQFGAFDVEPNGEGTVTLRDLLTGRRFEVEGELPDDAGPRAVAVGRLYPSGRGTYLRSPSTMLASPQLGEALRADLARQSEEAHARLSQRQVEEVFFPATPIGDYEPLEHLEAEVERWLRAGGVADLDLDDVRERFLASDGLGDAVGELLDETAFTSQADLETGRRLLPAYYAAVRARVEAARRRSAGAAEEQAADELRARAGEPCACGSGRPYGECCLPRDAVARFDAGRARGESLDGLIAGLQAAMGIDADADDEEEEAFAAPPAPPVTPLVAEFLWERSSTDEPLPDAQRGALEAFGRSVDGGDGAPQTIEELAIPHFERFLAFERYAAERAPAAGAAAADADALEAFAAWLRDAQDVDLVEALAPIAARIREDGDRLAAANAALKDADPRRGAPYAVSGSEAGVGKVDLEPIGRGASRLRVAAPSGPLRPGDAVLASPGPPARIERVLPAAARPFLERRAEGGGS